MISACRLLVNVDHTATLRNARGGAFPSPMAAAKLAVASGADGITVHLREDRRHIRDEDVHAISSCNDLGLFCLEMACTQEMIAIACAVKPDSVCIVPENRAELTTEGGLAVADMGDDLKAAVERLHDDKITVSLFVDATSQSITAASQCSADAIEIHTGPWADTVAAGQSDSRLLEQIRQAAIQAADSGLEVHAGHGLTYDSVGEIAAMPQVSEVSIGHFIIGQSLFDGIPGAVRTMKQAMCGSNNSTCG